MSVHTEGTGGINTPGQTEVVDVILSDLANYIDREVTVSELVLFSQSKLIRRIGVFKNRHFPLGKIDKDNGEYKYWTDIITPRVNSEIKNLRFDVKNILPFSTAPKQDFAAVFVLRAALGEWMRESGTQDELIDSIEAFSSDGNVLWSKSSGKKPYEKCDMENTFIINQAAQTVADTAVIQRYQMTQSDLRAKSGVWDNVENVIKTCGNKFYQKTERSSMYDTTNPIYEIYLRDGEITERALLQAQGVKEDENKGDANKYILARVIVAGVQQGKRGEGTVLFAEELDGEMCDYYKEAHRGPYKGRWWREGLVELLMDDQFRVNEISIQIARGLEWASRVIFKSNDSKIVQNIRTDLDNGDIIKSADLAQIDVQMHGLDELIADYNRIIEHANEVANSSEVVQGQSMPTDTSGQLAYQLDNNASKLFILLRGKLGYAYACVFREWVLPSVIKDLKGKDIIRVTGDPKFIDEFRKLAVGSWYMKNLVAIGRHTTQQAQAIKQMKIAELQQSEPLIQNVPAIFKGVLPRIDITITGENSDVESMKEEIAAMIPLEQDPKRRAFLLDQLYAAMGIPVPPTSSSQPQDGQPGQNGGNQPPQNGGGGQQGNQPAPRNAMQQGRGRRMPAKRPMQRPAARGGVPQRKQTPAKRAPVAAR